MNNKFYKDKDNNIYYSQYNDNPKKITDVTFYPYPEYESLPTIDVKSYKEDDLLELISKSNTKINPLDTIC